MATGRQKFRYLAAFMLLIGLIAGSMGTVAAADEPSTDTDTTSETTTETTTDTTTDTDSTTDSETDTASDTDTTSDTDTDATTDTDTTTDTTSDTDTDATTNSTTDTTSDTDTSTEPETESGGFSTMALDENTGEMVGPTSVSFSVPEGATFGDLRVVSANLDDVDEAEGDCAQGTGSPRFGFSLDTDDDGQHDGWAFAYVSDPPNFNSCGVYAEGENLVGDTGDRWETSQVGGANLQSWAQARASAGDATVLEAMLVVEAGSAVTPVNLIVQFNMPADPGTMLGTITVAATFVGPVDVAGDACFTVSQGETQVGEPLCIAPADIAEDGTARVTFTGLLPGDYTVSQTTVPEGFIDSGPVDKTVREGVDEVVTITNASGSHVTISITSSDASLATMGAGSKWTVSQDGIPVATDLFAEEHLALPSEIGVEQLVPFGTYTITIEAGDDFQVYTDEVVLDSMEERVEIELAPSDFTDQLIRQLIAILTQILSESSST